MITSIPLAMLGTGPGSIELLVVFAAILILFGPERLPGFAKKLGHMIEQLRSVSSEFRHQIMNIHSDTAPDSQSGPASDDITTDDQEEKIDDSSDR